MNNYLNYFEDSKALTCAVVIGVSKYESEDIQNLKYAHRDAYNFAEMLRENGVNDIKIFTDKEATRNNILEYISRDVSNKFQNFSGRKKMIIYFSGHGCNYDYQRMNKTDSVLFTYDITPDNFEIFGITIQSLELVVGKLCVNELYIFIDACYIKINDLSCFSPIKHEKLKCSDIRYYFAYVASADMEAYEDETIKSGVFTDCLIRNIRLIQKEGGDFNTLKKAVYNEICKKKGGNPEFSERGNVSKWLFEQKNDRVYRSDERVGIFMNRKFAYESLTNFIKNSGLISFIFGQSGIGKTYLIRKVLMNKYNGIYLSLPLSENVSVESIISDLVYQYDYLFPEGHPKASIDSTLRFLKINIEKDEVIVIDNTEHNPKLALELYNKMKQFELKTIFVGIEVNVPVDKDSVWECPRLLIDDIKELEYVNKICDDMNYSKLLNDCFGLPVKLIDIVNDVKKISKYKKNSMNLCFDALSATGGFISKDIFSEVFSVDYSILNWLISLGKLICIDEGYYVLHDSVYNDNYDISADLLYEYWEKQVKMTPYIKWACKQLIICVVEQKEIMCLHEDKSISLILAIDMLYRTKEWTLLRLLAGRLMNMYPEQIDALLTIAKIFVHRSNIDIVDKIMNSVVFLNCDNEQLTMIKLIQAEKLWWSGEYENSKQVCRELLKGQIDSQTMYEAKMHMGLSDFFLGNWEESLDSLSFADDIFNDASTQTTAWALYISATIIGLRGTDIKKGLDMFKAGILLLEQIGDDSGTASALGNMAEMNWKLGNYIDAEEQALKAYNIAKETAHIIDQIEIDRNRLHIYIRLHSPYDTVIDEIKKNIEDLLSDDIGDTVEMQVWNTFGTMYAYRGDYKNLDKMIEKAYPHTVNNSEYHIYTLSNMCLSALLKEKIDDTFKFYEEARCKALEGGDMLAVKQLNDDLLYVCSHYQKSAENLIYRSIEPYINEVNDNIKNQLSR